MLDTIHPQKGFWLLCSCNIYVQLHYWTILCFLYFSVFLLYQSFVWEAFWSRLTPQRTVLADSSVSKCCSTFRERQKPSSKSLWNQDSRSCFGQRQDCTLGGKNVSCETQSKSVFRIKISVKILKIQIRTLKSPQKRELKTVTFYLKQKKHLYSNIT